MTDAVAEQFEKLAEMICSRAERIKCPPEDFVEGVDTIIEQLQLSAAACKESNNLP